MAMLLLFMPRVAAVQADSEVSSVEVTGESQTEVFGPQQITGRATVLWWIRYWSDYYGYPDIAKAEAIVSCEGGFDDPGICNIGPNGNRRCTHGQGHFQIIPTTWISLQKSISVDNVFDTSDNIQAGIYLLKTGGDTHWGTSETPWGSWHCWSKKI